ncbi:MAG TPA: lysylphosphatidylglycerol synthase domain-containing protein [Candidatus Tectomicrobia bacterium]|nr:lysylphosphatidylglycerol synthase domain-containing protein [Candidatus Tectomicrobia bacterium]
MTPVVSSTPGALAGDAHAAPEARRPRWLSVAAGTAAGLALLAAVLAAAGVEDVWRSRRAIEPGALALYGLLTVVVYLMRARRFRTLIGPGATVPTLYGIVSVHTLMVNLLPCNAGDVSYPVLLKRYGLRADLLGGVPSLVVVRLQDVLITGVFLIVALALLGGPGELVGSPEVTAPRLAVALLALLAAAAVAVAMTRPAVRDRLEPLVQTVWASVRAVDVRVWLDTLAVGVLARLVAIVAVFYLFHAVGIGLPLATVLLINSLYTLLPLLPINAIAGLGITQAYLVTCFVASGIDRGVAVAASVQVHALQLAGAALLAALGWAQLRHAAGLPTRRAAGEGGRR